MVITFFLPQIRLHSKQRVTPTLGDHVVINNQCGRVPLHQGIPVENVLNVDNNGHGKQFLTAYTFCP